jgi:NADH-quinone oxidoreductase subunit I
MIGQGILKGMAVTARNFVGSYFEKERLITVQYPEERSPLPENYRNFPFLVFDGNDAEAGLRCVACQICEKECPPQCIYITKSKDKKPDYIGKPQFYPAVFDIDISVCMSCQICVEVCPFEAIKMDKDFELSRRGRFDDLLMRKGQLARSNEYYHRIHPIEAADVDARLAEAAAKKKPAPAPTPAAASAGSPPASSTTPPKPGETAPPAERPPAPKPPATTPPPAAAQASAVELATAVPIEKKTDSAAPAQSAEKPPDSPPTG